MSAILFLKVLVYPIEEAGVDLRGTRETDTEREVVQSSDTDGLAVYVLVDRGDSSENQVNEAIARYQNKETDNDSEGQYILRESEARTRMPCRLREVV